MHRSDENFYFSRSGLLPRRPDERLKVRFVIHGSKRTRVVVKDKALFLLIEPHVLEGLIESFESY